MWNLENVRVNGVLEYSYSRFIASWVKECTKRGEPTWFDEDFKEWLRTWKLSDEDIANIYEMANMGKLELELSIDKFLEEMYGKPKVKIRKRDCVILKL